MAGDSERANDRSTESCGSTMSSHASNNSSGNSGNSSCCLLKVVLFASGAGADAATYRPDADESQWWNRRDALVRCVSAFLLSCCCCCCGIAAASAATADASERQRQKCNNNNNRELVILFDQDWSAFYMEYHPPTPSSSSSSSLSRSSSSDDPLLLLVPTERTIIALWKRAAKAPGVCVTQDGLHCRLVTTATTGAQQQQQQQSSGAKTTRISAAAFLSSDAAASGISSKRGLLEYLQATCSMDFLRQNNSLEALVRKSNKSKLVGIKREWERLHGKKQKLSTSQTTTTTGCDSSIADSAAALDAILQQVLRPNSSSIRQVIAATLHESSTDELPCWDDNDDDDGDAASFSLLTSGAAACSVGDDDDSAATPSLQICLFLGAVRDMLNTENRSLRRGVTAAVCNSSCIHSNAEEENISKVNTMSETVVPLLRIRLGPVPEFTSKVLTVVAFHHAHNRLGPACLRMATRQQQQHHHQQAAMQKEMERHSKTTGECSKAVTPAVTSIRKIAPPPPPCSQQLMLHFVCLVPLPSDRISTALQDRNRVLWCMVRCTVTSLWRSRLAGGSSSERNILTNRLTFVFPDGVMLTLHQDDLVKSMAEQHQAAPSEYQILQVIRTKLDALQMPAVASVKAGNNPVQNDRKASSAAFTGKAIWRELLLNNTTVAKAKPAGVVDFCLDSDPDSDNSNSSNNNGPLMSDNCNTQRFYSTPIDRDSVPGGSNTTAATTTTTTTARKKVADAATAGGAEPAAVPILLIVLLSIRCSGGGGEDGGGDKAMELLQEEHRRALLQVAQRKKIPCVPGRSILLDAGNCIDQEGATITMVQHLGYQERLLYLLGL